MDSLLKKKIHEISLWLKMSFHREKQIYKSLAFIYNTILGES